MGIPVNLGRLKGPLNGLQKVSGFRDRVPDRPMWDTI